MGRIGWSRMKSGLARSLALLLGMFIAATAFTVLTAASRTAQLRTVGTVTAHFQPAYDILVRPAGARTSLESQTGTVQPDFLSGIYGGISMAQYHRIAGIPGVDVAAPIAMVGYSLLVSNIDYSLPARDYALPGRRLYRISTIWVSDGGTSRVTQPAGYIYTTPRPVRVSTQSTATSEELPGGRSVLVCPALTTTGNPFGLAAQSFTDCWSTTSEGPGGGPPSNPGFFVSWQVPVLIAAVDPAAEARLDGLNRAVISGRYLREGAGDTPAADTVLETYFPVLAASTSGLDESAQTQLQMLAQPAAPPLLNARWLAAEAAAPGRTLVTERTTAQQAYRQLLHLMSRGAHEHVGLNEYWTVSPARYRRGADGALSALPVVNPPQAWSVGPFTPVSMDNADVQYRKLTAHSIGPSGEFSGAIPVPQLVGTFDPARVQAFDPLSHVPLGPYQPLAARPASAASAAALHGENLLPNQNVGGLITQPVDLITTLAALPALQNEGYFGYNVPISDPISVIRVRVAGVTGPNPVSLERIKEVAQQIELSTHLDVDIVAGSSPVPETIDMPAGRFGQPALRLSEGWVQKGVATTILTAIDRSSVTLFVLILTVCALFVANSATAAVRGRRRELGVLACVGWTRSRLFCSVIGELAAIGLTAGLLGAAAALPAAGFLGLHASAGRALLAVPAALVVALAAGALPAWLAARASPLAAVRPPVLGVRRGRHPRGVTAMAMRNVTRMPGRAFIGTASLAVGIAALTVLTAVTFAFRGVVVGSLLGDAVAIQVRGVDYLAVAVTVILGVLAVADVVFLSISERAAELATLRAVGWGEAALSRLVITEGTVIGLAGSLAGAALGLAGAAQFTGELPARLGLLAVVAGLAGTVITATAAFLPARALRRLPTARLLAEE